MSAYVKAIQWQAFCGHCDAPISFPQPSEGEARDVIAEFGDLCSDCIHLRGSTGDDL